MATHAMTDPYPVEPAAHVEAFLHVRSSGAPDLIERIWADQAYELNASHLQALVDENRALRGRLAATEIEWSFRRLDPPGAPITRGTIESAARAYLADHAAEHPECRYGLVTRTVGPWLPHEDGAVNLTATD